MKAGAGLALLLAAVPVPALALAEPALEWSARAGGWASDRTGSDDGPEGQGEAWVRVKLPLADGLKAGFEGWAGVNPAGTGGGDGDVRNASLTISSGGLLLTAGRQVQPWGRADRFNPTDVTAARDYRRLVTNDDDNRLGLASVALSVPLAGGRLAAHWLPEFRATRLPIPITAPGLVSTAERPADTASQFALRYDRFGSAVDFSVSYAEVLDRTPWLTIVPQFVPGRLQRHHPRLAMLGADVATTVAGLGVRLEVAGYDYAAGAARGQAGHEPRFAAVLGIDKDFRGSWQVILQGIFRHARTVPLAPGAPALLAGRNDVIHQAWQRNIVGGTIRVRKALANDGGSIEASAAAFGGGGQFIELKATRRLSGSLRLIGLAQHSSGPADGFFGLQRPNNTAALVLAAGF